MKLLLTSAGITNQSIAATLADLIGKPLADVKAALIPTAANVERGNKDWFLAQLTNLNKYGFGWVDIVDISAPGVDWKAALAPVDVLVVSGGNTFHLLDQMRKEGFAEWYKNNLEKVYVGISAGSIVMTPSIAVASVDNGDVNLAKLTDLSGLGFVDFEISPHTPEHVSHEGNRSYKRTMQNNLYGLDDQSAIVFCEGNMKIISEGEWLEY